MSLSNVMVRRDVSFIPVPLSAKVINLLPMGRGELPHKTYISFSTTIRTASAYGINGGQLEETLPLATSMTFSNIRAGALAGRQRFTMRSYSTVRKSCVMSRPTFRTSSGLRSAWLPPRAAPAQGSFSASVKVSFLAAE
jgi:hypothetical protein